MWSKSVLGALGVAASLGVGGAAYAAANGSPARATSAAVVSAQPPGGSGASAGRAGKRARGLYARADHITLEVKVRGQWVTYDIDRGKVTAVSPTSITLARPDGQSVTEAIDSSTKYKGVASESDIRTGEPAQVVSEGGTAARIRQAPATQSSAGAATATATVNGSVIGL